MSGLDTARLKREAPNIAAKLLGEANKRMSRSDDLRFGTHGSLSVNLKDGTFYDHEADFGGGMVELVKRTQRCSGPDAVNWLVESGFIEQPPEDHHSQRASTFYDYCDTDGIVRYRVERTATKQFLQLGPDGKGGFRAKRGCMEGVERLPYRLPDIVSSNPDGETVYIVEGEKDADRLASLGLVATTNSGGAKNWSRSLSQHLRGRNVVILPDNDDTGAEHEEVVRKSLTGVAESIVTVRLPGLPPKGDVSDWLDAGGTAEALQKLVDASAEHVVSEDEASFQPLDLKLLASLSPQPIAWAAKPFAPLSELALFTGAGSVGKSLFMQQLAIAAAAGKSTLGVEITPGPAMFVSCEDSERELHWRLAHICKSEKIDIASLSGRLHLISLRGQLGNELATFDNERRLKPSPSYQRLEAYVREHSIKHVYLDNAAHLFSGNENDRSEVTQFTNLLNRLAGDTGASVVLLAHPSKATTGAGADYSGSTAWLNAVRSQFKMDWERDTTGEILDADARIVAVGKANYTRAGSAVRIRWRDFAFMDPDDLPADERKALENGLAAGAENAAFLTCLAASTERKQAVSHNKGTNYAPRIFAGMLEGKRFTEKQFEKAMARLRDIGKIKLDEPLWRGPNRVMKQGIKAANDCTDPSAKSLNSFARTLHGPPAPTPSQVIENTCTDPPAEEGYSINTIGAASRPAAPDNEEKEEKSSLRPPRF